MTTKQRGGWRPGAGRKQMALTDRKAQDGRVTIRISVETAALAQSLMLQHPEVRNIESLFEYALRRLADDTPARKGNNG